MAGETPVPLIFLPGALGAVEADGVAGATGAGREIRGVAYRSDDRLEDLIARVVALADEAGAERFDLLGQSYGGWIAQCVARAHPKRIRRLVLAHSFALSPRQAWRFRLGRRLLEGLPKTLLARLLARRAGRALAPVATTDPALHARLEAALAQRMREPEFWAVLAAQQRILAESLAPGFAALPPVAPGVPVLIIEGGGDPMVPPAEQARLRALFPNAQVRRFDGAGHISAIVEAGAFSAAVNAFLDPGP